MMTDILRATLLFSCCASRGGPHRPSANHHVLDALDREIIDLDAAIGRLMHSESGERSSYLVAPGPMGSPGNRTMDRWAEWAQA